jgi:hypothetical protein
MLYALQFTQDGGWNRALAYDDYGNDELMPFRKLHPFESCFCTLPFPVRIILFYPLPVCKPAGGSGTDGVRRRDL